MPEAEQLVDISSREDNDTDFNSEATESACSESTGSSAGSDTADAEAGGAAEQAADAPPAGATASADEYAGIWGKQGVASLHCGAHSTLWRAGAVGAELEDIEDMNTSVLDLADLEEAVRVAAASLCLCAAL